MLNISNPDHGFALLSVAQTPILEACSREQIDQMSKEVEYHILNAKHISLEKDHCLDWHL